MLSILKSFQSFLREENIKEGTIKSYIKDVEEFRNYIDSQHLKLNDIKEIHVRKYILLLKEKGVTNHTIARKQSSMRKYFKFLRNEHVMVHNPIENIKQPKLEARRSSISEEDLEKMINKIKANPRDHLLIRLLCYEKLKLSSVLTLRNQDYKKDQGMLYLGSKKMVVLKDETQTAMEALLMNNEETSFYLFRNQHGKRLSQNGAYYVIKKWLKSIERNDLRPIDLYK